MVECLRSALRAFGFWCFKGFLRVSRVLEGFFGPCALHHVVSLSAASSFEGSVISSCSANSAQLLATMGSEMEAW